MKTKERRKASAKTKAYLGGAAVLAAALFWNNPDLIQDISNPMPDSAKAASWEPCSTRVWQDETWTAARDSGVDISIGTYRMNANIFNGGLNEQSTSVLPYADRPEMLRTLMLVTSVGNPSYEEGNSVGLIPIPKGVGADIADGLGINNYDPKDPETSLKVAGVFLNEIAGRLWLSSEARYNGEGISPDVAQNLLNGDILREYFAASGVPISESDLAAILTLMDDTREDTSASWNGVQAGLAPSIAVAEQVIATIPDKAEDLVSCKEDLATGAQQASGN